MMMKRTTLLQTNEPKKGKKKYFILLSLVFKTLAMISFLSVMHMRDNDTGATTDTRAHHHHHHRPAVAWSSKHQLNAEQKPKRNMVAGTQEISM